MWWVSIISLIVEIVKLLLSLRQDSDSPALNTEFDMLTSHYRVHKDREPLRRFRDRLRQRRLERAAAAAS